MAAASIHAEPNKYVYFIANIAGIPNLFHLGVHLIIYFFAARPFVI
jgi:hypothetical protein